MAKQFVLPMVILTGWGGEGSDTGHGSGGTTGGNDIMACDFTEWLEMYGDDYDLDEDIDFDDYRTWWIDNGLDADAWSNYNTEPLYPPEPIVEPDPIEP